MEVWGHTHTNDVHQLGAKGDVKIGRSPDGYLMLPEKTKFGTETILELMRQEIEAKFQGKCFASPRIQQQQFIQVIGF